VSARPLGLVETIDSGAEGRRIFARERKEVQADIFAGEFLCPSDWLREAYLVKGNIQGGRNRTWIAGQSGYKSDREALLLPALSPSKEAQPTITHNLDESRNRRHLGQGHSWSMPARYGKTRTLVYRIKHLLAKGASPGAFLALTFSNKAAEKCGSGSRQ